MGDQTFDDYTSEAPKDAKFFYFAPYLTVRERADYDGEKLHMHWPEAAVERASQIITFIRYKPVAYWIIVETDNGWFVAVNSAILPDEKEEHVLIEASYVSRDMDALIARLQMSQWEYHDGAY